MTKEQYIKLIKDGHFEPLWFDLLNASGYVGILPNGSIVDRRYFEQALPISENRMFSIAKPKPINEDTFTLKCGTEEFVLKSFQSPRGLRVGAKRPHNIIINCNKEMDVMEFDKLLAWLHDIKAAMR